jgi:transposase InsO family protein
VEEVRSAVAQIVEDYNAEWRVEKNGGISPREARQTWLAAVNKAAA